MTLVDETESSTPVGTTDAVVPYKKPNAAALVALADSNLEIAKDFEITTQKGADLAAEELAKIKAIAKRLEDWRLSITRPMDQAKDAVMDMFREPKEKLAEAERLLKQAINKFINEQRRIAAEAQAKAEAAARAERERLEREAAEQRRKAAEEAAAAEKARAHAAALEREGKLAAAEAERRQAEALQAKSVESEEIAATKVDTAAVIVAPRISAGPVKVAGTGSRKTWKARVTDKQAFVAFIATRPDLLALVLFDDGAINKLAAALKGELKFPGVETYEDEILTSRAR